MTITNFANNHPFLIVGIIVAAFFIIRYLYNSGRLTKSGLSVDKIKDAFQQETNFFEPSKEKTNSSNDFFNTNLNELKGGQKNGMEN